MAKKWIGGAIQHPGALHRALHVPEDKPIPAAKMEQAMHSKDMTIRHMAELAKTLHEMNHGK